MFLSAALSNWAFYSWAGERQLCSVLGRPKLFRSDIRRPSTRNTLQLPLQSDLDKKSQLAVIDRGNCLCSHCTECGIYNNLYISGAPTREARVGQSPILMV